MLKDTEIVDLFWARDQQAISELSDKYGAVCIRVSDNILHSRFDAEECVNDAYLAVWNRVPPDRPDPLRAYLLRIVRNISITKYHALNAAKRSSHYDAAYDELEGCLADITTPEMELAARELSGKIDTFLGTLDREGRIMFVRRYWYSDSVRDIAEDLHKSSHYVSVKLARIRKRLRKYLMREGVES